MPILRVKPDDRELEAKAGEKLLEASLRAGIAHTHVCGGRARCSTCRVMVLEGLENCSPRNERETRMAERLHFAPHIRLACQTSIAGPVLARRLVLDAEDVALTSQLGADAQLDTVGEEKRLAILFSDIRNFTTFSEKLPPYDVIHLLNRYFHLMFEAIRRHRGRVDNIMGDGILALFGVEQSEGAALDAVRAGLEMIERVQQLEPYVKSTYGTECFTTGVGIHYGEAVMGTVGSGDTKRTTVIGDSVNFASRIESANKQARTRMLISQDTFDHVREQVRTGRRLEIELKGKSGRYQLLEVVGLRSPG